MIRLMAIVLAGSCASLLAGGRAAAMDAHGSKAHAAPMPMHGNREEAVAMVKKGVAFIKANGRERGYAEITGKRSRFRDRDLYLVVYGLDGTVRAHGQNEKMVGKKLIGLRDVDGKPFIKETVELARSKHAFWMDHKFTNPVTSKVHPMRMYCERLEDCVVCSGHFMF